MNEEEIKKEIKALQEKTKQITQSEESAKEYLRKSGIADILEKAKQQDEKRNNAVNKH